MELAILWLFGTSGVTFAFLFLTWWALFRRDTDFQQAFFSFFVPNVFAAFQREQIRTTSGQVLTGLWILSGAIPVLLCLWFSAA